MSWKVNTELKSVAVSCQELNVDPIDQGESLFFQKIQGRNISFH